MVSWYTLARRGAVEDELDAPLPQQLFGLLCGRDNRWSVEYCEYIRRTSKESEDTDPPWHRPCPRCRGWWPGPWPGAPRTTGSPAPGRVRPCCCCCSWWLGTCCSREVDASRGEVRAYNGRNACLRSPLPVLRVTPQKCPPQLQRHYRQQQYNVVSTHACMLSMGLRCGAWSPKCIDIDDSRCLLGRPFSEDGIIRATEPSRVHPRIEP